MCTGCKKDEQGKITEIYCEYDPQTKSGMPESGRKVKGTLHWLSCNHCEKAEVRLYDRLFTIENPNTEQNTDFRELMNPDSLKVLKDCYVEKYLTNFNVGCYLQFQRIGYFTLDKDSTPQNLIFNRTVGLKDAWGKLNKK